MTPVTELRMRLESFFLENGLNQTDVHFWLPIEWAQRGEFYCCNAELVMTYEGSVNHMLNLYDAFSLPVYDAFTQMVNDLGWYFEMGTHWYCGFYPLLPQAPPSIIVD